jgi:hypothetical protein
MAQEGRSFKKKNKSVSILCLYQKKERQLRITALRLHQEIYDLDMLKA